MFVFGEGWDFHQKYWCGELCLISHNCFCGALLTATFAKQVLKASFLSVVVCLPLVPVSLVRWFDNSFVFVSVGLSVGKKCKCATKSVGLVLCKEVRH